MSTTLPPDDGFDADEPGVQSATIPETEIHDVLSNERRIILLRLLREEGTRDVGSLAEEIAGVQTDEWPPPRNKRQSVYVTLHQAHLPKLDDMGSSTTTHARRRFRSRDRRPRSSRTRPTTR